MLVPMQSKLHGSSARYLLLNPAIKNMLCMPIPYGWQSSHAFSTRHPDFALRRLLSQVEKGRFQLYIAKLDVAGALLASCGGLLINSATFIDLYLVFHSSEYATSTTCQVSYATL